MKKVLLSIAALAVALGFTACSNEDEALSVKGGNITVLAMTETGTRTALESDGEGAYNVVWSEGDYIYVFAGNKIYNISSGAGSTTAKFTGPAVKPNQYIAYLYGTGNDYPTWPTCQTYKANTVDVFPMRAVGISDADGNLSPLQFKNFGGVLRLNVKGTATIKKIVVSANEYMSGELSMSWQSTAIDPIAAQISTYTGINSIELNCGTGVALDATNGTDFYIAVPENTYTGVEITLTDADGKTLTKKFKGTDGLKIERSKITKASFTASFPPAGSRGSAKATIGGEDVDVNCVQLWENGPKFAEYNVGAASASEYGGYYNWGKNTDKDANDVYKEGDSALTGDDDTATKLWGSNWRMPTQTELQALLANCEVEWTTVGGLNGCKFTGKGDYSSNSVFLPAAGYCDDGDVYGQGSYGGYWSSTPNGSDSACSLNFGSGFRSVSSDYRGNGCSVRAVLKETPATTGTAKAKINGIEVDVKWVQLWDDGPKFAEYNIGASSATDEGSNMTFTEATSAEYVWGANWCTPSKDEMEHLMTAAKGETDDKVKCEYIQEDGKWGFKFTGLTDGYTSNSVFFPVEDGGSDYGVAFYWSATADGSEAWDMDLLCVDGVWRSSWSSNGQGSKYLVRPVLKN